VHLLGGPINGDDEKGGGRPLNLKTPGRNLNATWAEVLFMRLNKTPVGVLCLGFYRPPSAHHLDRTVTSPKSHFTEPEYIPK
jgi:hypothetical protein